MRSIYATSLEPLTLEIQTEPIPTPSSDEVLIRNRSAIILQNYGAIWKYAKVPV